MRGFPQLGHVGCMHCTMRLSLSRARARALSLSLSLALSLSRSLYLSLIDCAMQQDMREIPRGTPSLSKGVRSPQKLDRL